MASIVISRGCYQRGSEVAKKVAAELGYECISREVLLEASNLFDIPELKLTHAIEDAPSLLERLGRDRLKYITYIRTVLLREVQKGNVVYHGFAGHFFLQGIPGVLKVRVFADVEERVKDEMEREGVSAGKARQTILKDDAERRSWALSLYGMDTADPTLYDLLLHIGTLTVNDAAKVIADTARLPSFQMTPEAKRLLSDRVLAAQVESMLLEEFPRVEVKVQNGEALIHLHTGLSAQMRLNAKEITARVENIAIELGGADKAQVIFDA